MLVRDGHEIGNHTFTHVALSNGPGWQQRPQLDLTEAVLVGHHRALRAARAPALLGDARRGHAEPQERELAELAGRRYIIALADYRLRGLAAPGVAAIVPAATPAGNGRGGVVMFHDGGGDRSADGGGAASS